MRTGLLTDDDWFLVILQLNRFADCCFTKLLCPIESALNRVVFTWHRRAHWSMTLKLSTQNNWESFIINSQLHYIISENGIQYFSAQRKNKMSRKHSTDWWLMFSKWYVLSALFTHNTVMMDASLHPGHAAFIHLLIVIAILMVSIRWLLTFPLTAVILLPHAAATFWLVITYFNHSCPSYLTFWFLLLPVLLDCCILVAYLDLCFLPDLVIPFCQPFPNFWLLMLS